MIYPSFYKYNAPYRGPRDSKELNKTLTSIKHDINIAKLENEKHRDAIYENIKHAIGSSDKAMTGEMNTAVELNGELQKYEGIDVLSNKLRDMESQLNAFLKNL